MADAALVANLDANLTQFNDKMGQSVQTADRSVKSIEDRFASANPDAGPMLQRFSDSAVAQAAVVGGVIGAAIGSGVTLAITKLHGLVGALSELGDRSDDIRIPVNDLQALSVAAAAAGVKTKDVDSALDHFTEVSKKTADANKDLLKALENIDERFVNMFKTAPTQTSRLLVIGTALNATTDEVKRAQLGLEAFGTENERLLGVLQVTPQRMDEYRDSVHRLGLEIDESAVKRAQEARNQLSLLSRVLTDEFSSSLAGLIPTFTQLVPYMEALAGVARDVIAVFAANDAAKPIESLQNELKTLQNQVVEMTDLRDRMQSGELTPTESLREKLRQFLGDQLGVNLTENISDLDQQIVAIGRRIDDVQTLIDAKGKPTSVTVRPAFRERPDLNPKDDKESTDAFERQMAAARRSIALREADTATLGMNTEARARARLVANLEEAAIRANTKAGEENTAVTDEQREKINKLADSMFAAEKRHRELATQIAGVNDALRFSGQQLITVIDQMTQKGANFGQIMQTVLHNLSVQMLSAAITGEGAFAKLFGTASATPGGVGGILGILASALGVNKTGSASVDRIYSANEFSPIDAMAGKAAGGPVFPGKAYLVGEKGPEPFIPAVPGVIIPNDVMRSMAGGNVSVSFAPQISAPGASQQDVLAAIAQAQRQFLSQVVPTVRNAILRKNL